MRRNVTRFVPGTAVSPDGSDEVRGQIDGDAAIALRQTDAIEMRGRFAPREEIPGGGRVESTRSGTRQGLGALLTVVGLPSHSQIVGGDRGVAIVPTATGAAAIGTF